MPEIIYVEMICHLSKQPQIENDLSDSYEVMSLKNSIFATTQPLRRATPNSSLSKAKRNAANTSIPLASM